MCKEDPKLSSLPGVIENLGSDLVLEIRQKQFFSGHLSFQDHIHEFRRNSLLHQFYWHLRHYLAGNMT